MIEFINGLTNLLIIAIGGLASGLLSLFPDSPFSNPSLPPSSINLGYITWVLDFPTWIQHFSLLITAIGLYYIIRLAARWLKLVRS